MLLQSPRSTRTYSRFPYLSRFRWGVGAELAGALQGDGLGVEGAHVQHLLEQRHERLGVLHGRRRRRSWWVRRRAGTRRARRSEEHTSELQSLMRISYAVFCLKKTKKRQERRYKEKRTIKYYF